MSACYQWVVACGLCACFLLSILPYALLVLVTRYMRVLPVLPSPRPQAGMAIDGEVHIIQLLAEQCTLDSNRLSREIPHLIAHLTIPPCASKCVCLTQVLSISHPSHSYPLPPTSTLSPLSSASLRSDTTEDMQRAAKWEAAVVDGSFALGVSNARCVFLTAPCLLTK